MVTAIVRGADHAAVVSTLDDYVMTADAATELRDSSASVLSAFGEPAALERTVQHALGAISAAQLARLRTGDVLVHSGISLAPPGWTSGSIRRSASSACSTPSAVDPETGGRLPRSRRR